jgi:hypothetical protein
MTDAKQQDLFPEELAAARKNVDKSIWPEFHSEEDFVRYAKQILPITTLNTLFSLLSVHKNTVIRSYKRKVNEN